MILKSNDQKMPKKLKTLFKHTNGKHIFCSNNGKFLSTSHFMDR